MGFTASECKMATPRRSSLYSPAVALAPVAPSLPTSSPRGVAPPTSSETGLERGAVASPTGAADTDVDHAGLPVGLGIEWRR
jgi:hypothetical protein